MNRLNRLQESFPDEIDALMVGSTPNYTYLSGFTGSSAHLVITRQKGFLITDFRYYEQAQEQAPHFELVRLEQESLENKIGKLLEKEGIECLGVEADHLVVSEFQRLEQGLPGVRLYPVKKLVEGLRAIKDEEEMEKLREASRLADAAIDHICRWLKPGVTEKEIALEIEIFLRRQGADSLAFPPVVVSGPRGSLPHGIPTDKPVQRGELLTIDLGACLNGYCSDMTRTVAIGPASQEQKQIYSIVLRAQQQALQGIKPGMSGAEADALARNFIQEAGFGGNFGHGLGHGVGMDVHEGPVLSPCSQDSLQPGMVFSVEPGIYLPDRMGVRIEDLVIMKDNGLENLNHSPKQLVEL